MDKNAFELEDNMLNLNNSELLSKVREDPKSSSNRCCFGCCCCFLWMIVALIAFLALCAGVAAIVLIVVYPNVTSTVDKNVTRLSAEFELLREKVEMQDLQLVDLLSRLPENPVTTEAPATTTQAAPLGSMDNPASSCKDIPVDQPSGKYYIETTSSPVEVYCDMDRTSCSCTTTAGWMRVASLDISDPSQQCPSGFPTRDSPRRSCSRADIGCTSTTFATYGIEYSTVCGRVSGYRFQTPDGFIGTDIEGVYVDGVSLTHGSPRQHIWTFFGYLNVPTTDTNFFGTDYFCASTGDTTYTPIWVDSAGCDSSHACCTVNSLPWFCKQLPQPTTDDIEFRLCGDESTSNEDTPIELIEIYVR